jgi:orotidine-5'-phosphate decarboxylase
MSGRLNRVVAALDFPTLQDAMHFVNLAGDDLKWCKVGMELFTREGIPAIERLKRENKKVFLDLKFHDIPNTVKGAVRSAVGHGVDMLTVHASGGPLMLKAAASASKDQGTKVVAVTVLTSLNEFDLRVFGSTGTVSSVVERLTEIALESGVDGIVCSPWEVGLLRNKFGHDFIAVTPGIRLPDDETGDQKRVTSPEEAFNEGADFIVVGRSLTAVSDPRKRLHEIGRRIDESKT